MKPPPQHRANRRGGIHWNSGGGEPPPGPMTVRNCYRLPLLPSDRELIAALPPKRPDLATGANVQAYLNQKPRTS